MEINKIILYSKSHCSFCNALDTFIREELIELQLDTMYIVVEIDKLPSEAYAYYAQIGTPFVEFRNDNDEVIFTAPGLPTIDEQALIIDGYDLSKLDDEEVFELKTNIAKDMFLMELANANVMATDKKYKDKELVKQKINEDSNNIYTKANSYKEKINLKLDKAKV